MQKNILNRFFVEGGGGQFKNLLCLVGRSGTAFYFYTGIGPSITQTYK